MDQPIETPAPAPAAPAPVPAPPLAPVADKAEAKAEAKRIAELEAQLEGLRASASKAERLAKQLEELQVERAAWQAGVTDPEGIEVARLFWGKLPEKDRPGLGDWLSGLKADPSTAPRALAAYLSASSPPLASAPAAPSTGNPPGAQSAKPLPNANAGALPTPSASSHFDAASIRALRQEAQRTGDYSKLREAMPAIREAIKG